MKRAFSFDSIPSPSYVVDEKKLKSNLELLKKIKEQAGVKIILAQKAFSNFTFYPLIAQYLDGAAASSINEARLAKEEMGLEVHSYSPAYKKTEFEEYLQYSSHIVFNSLSQYKHYILEVQSHQDSHHFSLRVNPEYSEVKVKLYNPVISGSRFGVNARDLDQIPEGISGLHFHALCENDSHTLERTLNKFESLFGKHLNQIKYLNLGGGHFITHPDYDVEHLIGLLLKLQEKYPHIEITLEPGSAIAFDTGYLVASVIDIVDSKNQKIAIIDASFTAHMPDCLEMPYQPRINGAKPGDQGPFVYKIGGNSCLSGDFVESYSFDKMLQIGDRLIFEDQIHYTMVKTTQFNGVEHPSIFKITENETIELIKSFGYEDYKNKLG